MDRTNSTTLVGGSVLCSGTFRRADIEISGQRIEAIRSAGGSAPSHAVDCRDKLVLPGLIDLQVNGGGGLMFSLDIARSSYEDIARAHASVGTTALCPTIISGPSANMLRAVSLVADMCEGDAGQGAAFLGVHVEGPFLCEKRRGGHASEHLRLPSLDLVREFLAAARGHLAIFTIAPELPGALEVIEFLVSNNVHVSAGHTAADASAIREAIRCGLSGVTHLYNGMEPLASRSPGPVGVALSSRLRTGLICDFLHVCDDAIMSAIAAKNPDDIYLTTDAVGPLAADAKTFELYGTRVTVRDGGCYTDDGVLAGTATPLSVMCRSLRQRLDIPVAQVVRYASSVPAAILGVTDRGAIRPGAVADILITDKDLRIERIFVRGHMVQPWERYSDFD